MTRTMHGLVLALLMGHVAVAGAQPRDQSEPRTATAVIVDMITGTEKELIGVAQHPG